MRARHLLLLVLAVATAAFPAAAQADRRVNIYRYLLDVDVPESAGLLALDAATSRVVRGAAPKPLAASVVQLSAPDGSWRTGVALDASPYYLLGGGRRTLESYRRMTVAGRLHRVLTKTTISIAALNDPSGGGIFRPAVAVRSTFHDPHDPVAASRLPEQIDSALVAAGLPPLGVDDEQATAHGVNLNPLYAAARRTLRARGDVRVSGGWAMATSWEHAEIGESLDEARHTLWLTGQHARGALFDLIATVQWLDAFGDHAALRAGLGVQRKGPSVDLRLEAFYDGTDGRFHPGIAIEATPALGVGLVGAVQSVPTTAGAPAQARLLLLLRWYAASDR